MSYLDDLRKKSKQNYEALKSDVEKQGGTRQTDDRFWKITVNAEGAGSAILRFLPAPKGENTPYVKKYSHSFKGPNGRWFIENCPTTLGKPCPICERNVEIWNTNTEEVARKLVGDMKRKLEYFANVYVKKDSLKPENDGKVFLYGFGSKIFEKLKAVIKPEFEDDRSFDPFDLWEGADFKLRAKVENDYRTYSPSEFAEISELLDGDAGKLEEVINSLYSLQSLVDEKQFKSYEELSALFSKVIDKNAKPKSATIEDQVQQDSPVKDENVLPFDTDSRDPIDDGFDIDKLLKDIM